MRLLIFGTGLFYQNRREAFAEDKIVAFVDNDANKWNTVLEGVPVILPENIRQMDYDFICLMAKGEYVEQMRKQLEKLKVPYEKIIDFWEYKKIEEGNKLTVYYGRECVPNDGDKILLLTHELSYSGAPLVLFYVAQILRKRGYFVTVLSLKDGELRKDFLKEGITVIIQEDIRRFEPVLNEWFQKFDLVWGNTVTYYYWVDAFNRSGIPFIWWLHESAEAYEWLGPHRMPQKVAENVRIYAAGGLALRMAEKYIPNGRTEVLLYGSPDFCAEVAKNEKSKSSKVIFAIIGTICPRKAQDIFLEAIEALSDAEREKAEFWVIGSILNQEFYEQILGRLEAIPEIKVLGAYNRDEMRQVYQEIDIVVCPSREDPLPVVATEAMIMSKASIVSTMTGTADLITEKENGFICEAENPLDLAEKMRWILDNKELLPEIGKNARKLYEEKFAMEVFEKNVEEIVSKAIAGHKRL